MDELLKQFEDDLEDLAQPKPSRFSQADEAERRIHWVISQGGKKISEPAIQVVIAWWEKHRPPRSGHEGIADHSTILALVASARAFADGL